MNMHIPIKQSIITLCLFVSHIIFCSPTEINGNNKPSIAIIGTGYVGLVSGAGLAEIGNTVVCADVAHEKIAALRNGIIPIYEPGLDELVARNVKAGRLSFTDNTIDAIEHADVIFIAVGTPMGADGSADLAAVHSVTDTIADNLQNYKIIVTKSTVPIGTGAWIRAHLIEKGYTSEQFDVVSNPEFLREGVAVNDFLYPDRIVIGVESDRARTTMETIYQTMIDRNTPTVFTTIATSETIKYAANAMLAIKISFMNEMANLCATTGAKVYTVAHAMGLDRRIGPLFLNPGPGFGGSCFPKDCEALMYMADQYEVSMHVVKAALKANKHQKKIAIQKLSALMQNDWEHATVAVLGLAFKANTDDIRYSPAITTIKQLLKKGAQVRAYDPAAMKNMQTFFPDIVYADSPYEAVRGADALIILTEWNEFKTMDLVQVAQLMNHQVVIDMRGILDLEKLQALGFTCDTIGK